MCISLLVKWVNSSMTHAYMSQNPINSKLENSNFFSCIMYLYNNKPIYYFQINHIMCIHLIAIIDYWIIIIVFRWWTVEPTFATRSTTMLKYLSISGLNKVITLFLFVLLLLWNIYNVVVHLLLQKNTQISWLW